MLAKHGSSYNLEFHAEPGGESIERMLAVGYQNGVPAFAPFECSASRYAP